MTKIYWELLIVLKIIKGKLEGTLSDEELEKEAEQLAKDNDCPFVDNETPYGRAKKGHPVIVDYFYHEEVRGSNNTGKRNRKHAGIHERTNAT